MFEEISIENVSQYTPVRLDTVSVGRAYLTLVQFMQGDETVKTFKVDPAALNALRDAAARVCGMAKDRTVNYTQYTKAGKNGSVVWKRLRKGAKAPSGSQTREATLHVYSAEAKRNAIATLAETHGVSINRLAELSGVENDNRYHVVSLVKSAS
jgi:hypothetical protein